MKILGQFHTGFVVQNLEKSLSFYVDILKFNIERGPLVLSGEWISDVVGENNVKMKQAHVGTGEGHSIELIQYISYAYFFTLQNNCNRKDKKGVDS